MNLSRRQQETLRLMGINVWVHRDTVMETPAVAPDPLAPGIEDEDTAWRELEEQVINCSRCELYKTRTRPVFGVGNRQADLMLIGEAPGAEEDRQGEPFVGRAGKLLNAMLEAVGFQREDVYIANILKSRPPKNRDPKPEEVAACEPYLKKQIELVNPRLIVALGRVAAQNLLKVDTPIGRMRGKCYDYPEPRVPVVVTYHPAYLLRSPREKRKSWQDLGFAMKILRGQ
ncbi:MAG: uracil-DNA glycosylase [Gammaproteobacteria bacterium]